MKSCIKTLRVSHSRLSRRPSARTIVSSCRSSEILRNRMRTTGRPRGGKHTAYGCGCPSARHAYLRRQGGQRMQNTTQETTVATLNGFLRGEISAVETYRQALDKLQSSPSRMELEECRRSHAQRVERLRQEVVRL